MIELNKVMQVQMPMNRAKQSCSPVSDRVIVLHDIIAIDQGAGFIPVRKQGQIGGADLTKKRMKV